MIVLRWSESAEQQKSHRAHQKLKLEDRQGRTHKQAEIDKQAPPAKRQRRTTKKSDYSSSLSFSVNSDAEQDLVASDR